LALDTRAVSDEEKPIFSYLQAVVGDCPSCGAPLKWAEVKGWRAEDGISTVSECWLVCQNNHLTPGGAVG
jgi:hypothetical protein